MGESSSSGPNVGTSPVVAVFRREYATPTETFVVGQVRSLSRYAPVVLCRSRMPGSVEASGPRLLAVRSFAESGLESGLDRWAYRHLRRSGRREDRWYADAMADSGASVVHAHFGTDGGYILPAVRAAKLPLVVSWYGYDVSQFPGALAGFGRAWLRPILREATLHLAMTPQMAAALSDLGATETAIRIQKLGIDCSYWAPEGPADSRRPAGTRILLVASFVEKKGHLDLIKAFAEACVSNAECRLRLVGTGPLEAAARELASALGIRDRVDFLGFLPYGEPLLQEYRSATIYAHPSRTASDGDQEGLPTAILEAMSCGLPVVSTRHAGIPDAVSSDSGILVDEGDVHAIADAIRRLLGDAGLRENMGKRGRARVLADYDLSVQARRLESLYDEARDLAARKDTR